MEDFLDKVLDVPFVCSIVFLVMGGIMYFAPPKKINGLYGYRTASSMKSQERWDFSQKYSAIKMMVAGLIMLLFSLISYLFKLEEEIKVFTGIGLLLAACVYMIITTESAIKKRFKDSNTPQ